MSIYAPKNSFLGDLKIEYDTSFTYLNSIPYLTSYILILKLPN